MVEKEPTKKWDRFYRILMVSKYEIFSSSFYFFVISNRNFLHSEKTSTFFYFFCFLFFVFTHICILFFLFPYDYFIFNFIHLFILFLSHNLFSSFCFYFYLHSYFCFYFCFIYAGPNGIEFQLDKKLSENGIIAGDDIMVMVVNEGEIDLYLNFICSCKQNKIDMKKILVFAASR